MKGFKKDGKFRPTGNRTKSSISKEDAKIKNKFGQSAEAIENQHSIAIKRRKESLDDDENFDDWNHVPQPLIEVTEEYAKNSLAEISFYKGKYFAFDWDTWNKIKHGSKN